MKNYYMHTLDHQPAVFQDGHIVFAGKQVTHLAKSLTQIRAEQVANRRWCDSRGVSYDPNEYGYVLIPSRAFRP